MNIESFSSSAAPAPLPPPLPRRRVHWMLWLVLVVSLLLNLRTLLSFGGEFVAGFRENPAVSFVLAYGSPETDTCVAVLRLDGPIFREGTSTFFGPGIDPVSRLIDEIRAATLDSDFRGILLEVNSPGGGVTASDEIYHELRRFRESHPDRRIVVHIQDIAASGAYYAAMAGDWLIAQPTSIVGSVGVLISAVNFHELGQKLGIQDVTLASSGNKALLNPFSPVNPDHAEILQKVVDRSYLRFRDLVLENRPFDSDFADTHRLLDGRVFTLPDAQELGLVDETGYGEQARERMLHLLDAEQAGFYEVSTPSGLAALLSARLPRLSPVSRTPRLLYLWNP